MDQLLAERAYQSALAEQGLTPTKSVLFTGAPGVGKSLMAKWIAHRLQRPLVTLDLSAVMSSFLGKTGANIRHVLDYAKASPCVLFLDELDSVAKRRDDATEIGELKRLVTVLLQEIDEWPASGLLIAATNHPALLDPAIWRRFDLIIDFPMPKAEQVRQAVTSILRVRVPNEDLIEAVSIVLDGYSFSDIGRELNRLIKQSVMVQAPLEDVLREYIRGRMSDLRVEQRKTVASCFLRAGFTQRETHEWTGVHRDTLRKMGMSTTDSE
jgi:SpoVK/Ycf46/Vps4 family AAA+-type ATPase